MERENVGSHARFIKQKPLNDTSKRCDNLVSKEFLKENRFLFKGF